MIALRLTYNGNVDGGLSVSPEFAAVVPQPRRRASRRARAGHGPDRLHAICLRHDRL